MTDCRITFSELLVMARSPRHPPGRQQVERIAPVQAGELAQTHRSSFHTILAAQTFLQKRQRLWRILLLRDFRI